MGRAMTPEPGSVPAPGEAVCYATFSDGFQRLPGVPGPRGHPVDPWRPAAAVRPVR